jgi:hypothetical protein
MIRFLPSGVVIWRELLVPDELTTDQVVAFIRHMAAVRQGPVCLRVRGQLGRVRFLVGAPDVALSSLIAAASGLLPEVRFEDVGVDDVLAPGSAIAGQRVSWRGPWPLLRADHQELTLAGLLGVLASMRLDEQLELQLRLWPVGRIDRPVAGSERSSAPVNPWFMRLFWPAQPPREDVRAIRAKYSGLLLRTEIGVVAAAATEAAAISSSHRLVAALRTAGGLRGVLRYRSLRGRAAWLRFQERRRLPLPWELTTVLSPEELAGLSGLPVAAPRISGISYGVGPRLMPPLDLPSTGRVFARSTWPGTLGRPLAQPVIGGLQHAAIVGPTGSGKSTLVANLIRAEMLAGRGAFVLDLKGDLVSDLLKQVPRHRRQDVVVLEPARGGAQPGLQLFPAASDAELTSDLVLGTLRELFKDSWGIRSSQYLGMGLKTLAALPGATLVELPLLFGDARLRQRALRRVSDPWLRQAWQRFLALSPADQALQLASPLTKLEELVGRARLRLVLGQSRSRLDFNEVLARKRVVLVSLPPGLLGMPATRLLAALTLWQFFQAVEARAGLPAAERSPFMAYVDEVAVLSSLPLPLDGLLERARGHGVGLTLSPQALSQLTPALRASLLANIGSVVAFQQTSEEEGAALARALPGVTGPQLQHLGRYEVAMRLSLGPGAVTATMTGKTVAPEPGSSDPDEVRRLSGERWGQSLADIDAALTRRHGLTAPHAGDGAANRSGAPRLGVKRRRP